MFNRIPLCLVGLFCLGAMVLPGPLGIDPIGGDPPKTIILGFDGVDYSLAQQWMDDGTLPHLKALSEKGLFQPLETSNPAQSPVSWGVFNTGQNPGKTGVAGFVSRRLTRDDGTPTGTPLPQPMLLFDTTVSATETVSFPMALENRSMWIVLVALSSLLIVGALCKFVLRRPQWLVILLALAAGVDGARRANNYADALPADGKVPYVVNPRQGTNFWSHLDAAGVRMRGVTVPVSYPPDREGPNTTILSGLGVPDIGGSPGTWYVYTDDPWILDERTTATSGRIVKVFPEEPDYFEGHLVGPKNWIVLNRFVTRLADMEAMKADASFSVAEVDSIEEDIAALKNEQRAFKRKDGGKTTVPFVMEVDRDGGRVRFEVGGEEFWVEEGEWSDFVRVEFVLNDLYSAHGQVRFHVMECGEEMRVFVPPLNIDPLAPPEHLPLSSPPSFATELAESLGHGYETIGWPSMTNPLKDHKDSHFYGPSFVSSMANTLNLRRELLWTSMDDADDWDVYFQVFGTLDRMAHLMYREMDPDHPLYDADYASTPAEAFGGTFPLSEAVKVWYQQMDVVVGKMMERMDRGDFGSDPLLLIVSDHGFQSFRRMVNLNNLLHDFGFLAFKPDEDGSDRSVEDVFADRETDLLRFIDWERTRAYSLGLGKIFVNLAGREPNGTVNPEDYDALLDDIIDQLKSVRDGDGTAVVTSCTRRDSLFEGPWWKEGTAERWVAQEKRSVRHDGFADLFLGYAPTYRVSWSNTSGGLDRSSLMDNDSHWSGDHVSMDPSHVPGVLFSSTSFSSPSRASLLDIGPTMLARYGVDPAPDMDGVVLPLKGM